MHRKQIEIKNLRLVAFATETYPSFAGGGRSAFNFCKSLAHNGAHPSIVCLNYNKSLKSFDTKDGVFIQRIAYYNKNLFSKLLSIPTLCTNYFGQIFKNDVIVIYGYFLPLTWLIIMLGILAGKKVVFRSTMLEVDDYQSIANKSFGKIHLCFLKRVTLYFAINEKFAKLAKQLPSGLYNKIFTSYQGS